MPSYPAYRVAAMHVSPVFLDTDKTTDKVCSLIAEAAANGARLVAFSRGLYSGLSAMEFRSRADHEP